MPFGSRRIRFPAALALLLGLTASGLLAQAAPLPPPPAAPPVFVPPTTAPPAVVPAAGRDSADTAYVPVRPAPAGTDTAAATARRTAKDSLRPPQPVFRWETPRAGVRDCPVGRESAPECWRRDRDLANQEIGFAGPRGWTLSLTHYRPLPQTSPYFPFWSASPFLSGGLAPPERFVPVRLGADLAAMEEAWTPVVPLDTPFTRLDWERGALSLNVFNLRLNRMLSDRVYLGFDFHSASADSLSYDYQFNVHQPYLGGWGFLGRLHPPIDRDSASLVLEGVSHAISALVMRPRVGIWIDTNRVLEVFLDRTRNSSSLTFPYGPSSVPGSPVPGGPDSSQALMPAGMASLGQGLIYGETGRHFTSQWEISHGSLEVTEFRRGAAGNQDRMESEFFRMRGAAAATGFFGRPTLSLEARSELWEGPLAGNAPARERGWADAQEADAGWSPRLGLLEADLSAGAARSSRMDDQVHWLERGGARVRAALPLGFGAEAAASSRKLEPAWETLYRSNPARFLYANPALEPRTDRTYRAGASWSSSRFSLEAGLDLLRSEDAWLPRVLPGPGACATADSLYPSAGAVCSGADSAGGGLLPDSLALARRNYSTLSVDAWYLGVGLGLGNWRLDLRNRFLFGRTVEDRDVRGPQVDWSIPARVFKGRLGWNRDLLDGRMNLDLGWDWEWFSHRYAWVPDLAGGSRVIKLDEYLALDFEAAMRIRTFILFFKARNFNHDRYATEPGVHPPGINFRFGVDWVIWN